MIAFGEDFRIVDEQRKERDLERQKGYVKVDRTVAMAQAQQESIEK
jgi:hypothetical protein